MYLSNLVHSIVPSRARSSPIAIICDRSGRVCARIRPPDGSRPTNRRRPRAVSRCDRRPFPRVDSGEAVQMTDVACRDRHDVAGTADKTRLRREDAIGVERVRIGGRFARAGTSAQNRAASSMTSSSMPGSSSKRSLRKRATSVEAFGVVGSPLRDYCFDLNSGSKSKIE